MTSRLRPALSRQLENAGYGLLLAIAALAPLPFGSNGSESMLILSTLSGLVLALTALALIVRTEPVVIAWSPWLTAALLSFMTFGLWAVVQIVPGLPGGLPHPLWAESARVLGTGAPEATISIDPAATWAALTKSGGYFAAGVSAVFLLREPQRRRGAVLVLVLSGGLYAAYGLIGLATGDCCVAWQRKADYLGVATGPFINRNSFATYLGLICIVCIGLLLREFGELRRVSAESVLQRLTVRLGLVLAHQWWAASALLAAAVALLLTLSRAGMTSTLLAAGALVLLLSQARLLSDKRRPIVHLAAFAGVAGLSLFLFGSSLINRVASEGVEDSYRTQSWKIMIDAIEASPWLGHGFGTFPEAFPLYRDDRLPSRRYWDKAQNTYIELAMDMGIPATAVLLLGFGALAAQCAKGLSRRRRERRLYPALGLAAMVLVGAHAIFDFSMQIPAIATIFAFIMGIAIAESGIWRSRDPSQSSAT